MMLLSRLCESRDNNFNLIRFGAALGVFISHCFPLADYGVGGRPQLLGFISLNVFFIISGFLVTKSYFDRSNVVDYARSRALRIFPALILAVIYSVFIIGLIFSALPTIDYLKESQIYEYVIKHTLLLLPDSPEQLPGVFMDSPYHPIVNAPLWSLPYEVWCYLTLGALASLSLARNNKTTFTIICITLLIVFYTVFALNYFLQTDQYAYILDKNAYRLGAMFLIGVVFYLGRDKITISHTIAVAIIIILLASRLLYKPAFVALAYSCIAYLILYFAYVPDGFIRSFNKIGDYSYGIYIFGYPTQQATEQLMPDLSLPTFFIVSFSITLMLAVLSWHFVEKKALSYKAPKGAS